MLIAPILGLLGIDFALNELIEKGKVKLSRESEMKYKEIDSEYKQKLIAWAKKRGINLKNPSKREQSLFKEELKIAESEALDKFIDYLKANRKRRDIRALAIGAEFAKVINEKIKGRF